MRVEGLDGWDSRFPFREPDTGVAESSGQISSIFQSRTGSRPIVVAAGGSPDRSGGVGSIAPPRTRCGLSAGNIRRPYAVFGWPLPLVPRSESTPSAAFSRLRLQHRVLRV